MCQVIKTSVFIRKKASNYCQLKSNNRKEPTVSITKKVNVHRNVLKSVAKCDIFPA